MTEPRARVVLLPDAGPLITLAYADSLDALMLAGWPVAIVDMVLHEVTRNATPTSRRISRWVKRHELQILRTRICERHLAELASGHPAPRKSNLGELAIQEAMHRFALERNPRVGVFLFEDHRIARTSFVLPDNCRKVSTRAFLQFLEQDGHIASAAEVERLAVHAGRSFSRLRFPP